MKRLSVITIIAALCCLGFTCVYSGGALGSEPPPDVEYFPPSLDSYDDADFPSIWAILKHRVQEVPFNLVATLIFFCAIIHTFLTSKFMAISHQLEEEHLVKIANGQADRFSVCHKARFFHFQGEVEAVFGMWAVVLVIAIVVFYDWSTAVNYIGYKVNFTEPAFVVVIMTLASTRPILSLTESIIKKIARLFGGTLTALWLTTLTIGPLLGSFITEPAAMTISALVLARNFYDLQPSLRFKYATLGLLFVNISVGGTLTHFAAPPVLMVAEPWGWTTPFMLSHFGVKAIVGILISNALYFLYFRKELAGLEAKAAVISLKQEIREKYLQRRKVDATFDQMAQEVNKEEGTTDAFEAHIEALVTEVKKRLEQNYIPDLIEKGVDPDLIHEAFDQRFEDIRLREMRRLLPGLLPSDQRGEFIDPDWDQRDDPVPFWVTLVHISFMFWTILNAHHPPMFILGMLFFLGFAEVTEAYQNRINLKPAMLVGFFLAGLVIHGGLQGWWIAPILGSLSEVPLAVSATVLTAFNDNAAITYLATLVPGFTDGLKYAVVAGAVTGGGLTIIANAPNPAGVSLLKKYFNNEVSAIGILGGALIPTIIMFTAFILFR